GHSFQKTGNLAQWGREAPALTLLHLLQLELQCVALLPEFVCLATDAYKRFRVGLGSAWERLQPTLLCRVRLAPGARVVAALCKHQNLVGAACWVACKPVVYGHWQALPAFAELGVPGAGIDGGGLDHLEAVGVQHSAQRLPGEEVNMGAVQQTNVGVFKLA